MAKPKLARPHHDEQEHGAAHKNHTKHGDGAECLGHERHFGSLRRQLYVGRGLDADKAKADFQDGVLRVSIPVLPEKQPKRAHVNGSANGTKSARRGLT